FINLLKSLKSGTPASENPWDAPTLEWAVPSPPPPYNFAVIPTVASRYPLWDGRLADEHLVSATDRGMLLAEGKETVGTSALDAHPDMILEMPEDSFAPLWLSIGLTVVFVGMLCKMWLIIGPGVAICVFGLLLWLWPRRELREREASHG